MRAAVVIKAFPYAADGINIEHLPIGRILPMSDTTFQGLKDAGYVEAHQDENALPVDEALNKRLVEALDRKLAVTADQDLLDLLAQSGEPYGGELVRAQLVAAAKEQMIRQLERTEHTVAIVPKTPASTPAVTLPDPLDHDGDGRKGGSLPKADAKADLEGLTKAELEKLAAERSVDIASAKTKADIVAALVAVEMPRG